MLSHHQCEFRVATAVVAGAACLPVFGSGSIDELAGEADLVFRGVVQDISYGLSAPSGPEAVRIPFTFVTYRVDDLLLGEEPGATVTLRFVGGLDIRQMQYLAMSHAPQFDVGDEDILFVQGNTKSLCPLVKESTGRLRVIDGQMYSETGRAVALADDGRLLRGKRHQLEEAATTNVLGLELRRSFELDADVAPGLPEVGEAVGVMANRISDAVDGIAPAGRFEDADPGQPIPAIDMTPAPPPAEHPAPPSVGPLPAEGG